MEEDNTSTPSTSQKFDYTARAGKLHQNSGSCCSYENPAYCNNEDEIIELPTVKRTMSSTSNATNISDPFRTSCALHIEGDQRCNSPYGNGNKKFGSNNNDTCISVQKKHSKPAVTVRNAYKRFGNGPEILNNFSMTIQKGTIYSLLGSSGCGKTTLLSCIVGVRNVNSGEILVFGAKPGTKESGIPGKRVGYMPQDLALYNDFSIQESMRYFGTIYSMSSSQIKASQDFLIGFLDLPDASRRIATLSGGQKRRVSLALSLVHSPELLILDEPTVGVDPLLRESIWNHLCKLVASEETTVIITTHYIEEARQSNMIGLMRGGRLLSENSPESLLQKYNTTLLEDIVLQLCRKDAAGNIEEMDSDGDNDSLQTLDYDMVFDEPYEEDVTNTSFGPNGSAMEKAWANSDLVNVKNRIMALIQKNWVVMMRNIILLAFMIWVPAFQVFLICMAIGNDPKPMWMGVVNYETNYSAVCLSPMISHEGCDVENLSCKFIAKLPKDVIYLREYVNEELARDAVTEGKIWGFMTFHEGYSDYSYSRSASGNVIDEKTLNGSQILLEMDLTSKQIAGSIKRILYDAYRDYAKEMLSSCGLLAELGDAPIKYLEPIYGTDDTDFKEYVAPSALLGMMFFFPLCSSGVSYIWDKKQGTLERARVAGVNTWEIMVAFFITESVVFLLQSLISFSIVMYLFDIHSQGSTFLAICITMLMGFAGLSMGFLMAAVCNEEIEAVLIAMGLYFPNFLLSGMIWPIEGMPKIVQTCSYFLPCTLALESIRSIISRGWGFSHIRVWPGFATTLGWTCCYWTTTIMIHRFMSARR